MVNLYLRDRKLSSVFELLGSSENSITSAIGWALAQSPTLRAQLSSKIGLQPDAFTEVRLQQFGEDRGFTDIELIGEKAHAIVEAKKGWWLPGEVQLRRYAPRFIAGARKSTHLIAMSDCSSDYARLHLDTEFDGMPLHYFGWRDIDELASCGKSNAEKRLLQELRSYLRTIATMQNPFSNMVFVVSLGAGCPNEQSISWIDIVNKRRRYFHPVGNRWPKEPPNYIAFRYGGQLRSIHHIDSFVITCNIGEEVDGFSHGEKPPHFVYELGEPILPSKVIKNGPRIKQSARVWAMLDLLLTCDTISEAWEKSKLREGKSI